MKFGDLQSLFCYYNYSPTVTINYDGFKKDILLVRPMYLISLPMTGNREMLAQLPTSTRHKKYYLYVETLYMALCYSFHLIHKILCSCV